MEALKLASCMAENTESFCRAMAIYIQHKLGIRVEYVDAVTWQQRQRLFDAGRIHLLWLCGLPYIDRVDVPDSGIELLAVPVPAACRYQDRPIYFSDIVVRRDSHFKNFADLRGTTWVYNEARSHSGYNVVRAYLAAFGEKHGFFSQILESGAHTASLAMVLTRQGDVSAIDSTVLEWAMTGQPDLERQLRIVETIGPSPIPPWVVSKQVAANLRADLRDLFIGMHKGKAGRSVLRRGHMARFVLSHDRDYDPIRRMAQSAEQVLF